MKNHPRSQLGVFLLQLLQGAQKTVAAGKALDVYVTQQLRRSRFSSRDRRLLANTVFSWFRWWGWIGQLEALGPETQAVLVWLLDGREEHPVMTDFLSRSLLADRGVRPLGEAPLAGKQAAVERWFSGISVVSFSTDPDRLVPDWFGAELFCPDGTARQDHRRRCIEAFQQRPPTWLAVARDYQPALLEELARQKLEPAVHPRLEEAVSVSGSLNLAPAREKWRGLFWVQDLASQAVVRTCAAAPGQSWWDTCAGAGGKTLGLLRRMAGRGSVLATDRRAGVLTQLARRVAEAGGGRLSTGVLDVTRTQPSGDLFDGVLVDAPCTAIGTWHRNPDARWRTPRSEISAKARLQMALLQNASKKVKPGGVLVYAVCTLSQAETEGVLDDFLTENPAFVPDPLAHPLSGESTPGFFWIWPWEGPADGMFVARLRRRKG